MLGGLIDARKIPSGLGVGGMVVSERCHKEMPVELYLRGYELCLVEMRHGTGDPYVLYDQWGHIVYEWPEGIEPTWQDVFEVLRQI